MAKIKQHLFVNLLFILLAVIGGYWLSQKRISSQVVTRKAIQENVIPLASVLPGTSQVDLESFGRDLKDIMVLGLGEATHGTKEFISLKHRLIAYLVENLNFTVIGIETSFCDAMALNEYLLSGQGNAKQLLHALHYPLLDTQEMLSLLEWLRAYNADASHPRKVKFYGIDTPYNASCVEKVLAYVAKWDSTQARRLQERWQTTLEKGIYDYTRRQLSDPAFSANLAQLEGLFRERKAQWQAQQSIPEYQLAQQYLALLKQAQFRLDNQAHPARFLNARDSAMAENIAWIRQYEGTNTKMVIWAHNYHLQKSPLLPYKYLGYYLAKALGHHYFALALEFNQGSFLAFTGNQPGSVQRKACLLSASPSETLPGLLVEIHYPHLYLKIDTNAHSKEYQSFIHTAMRMHMISASYEAGQNVFQPVVLRNSFDGLMFIHYTTAATPNDP